jgi:Tfp pilus assembly protein PilO
MDKDRLWFLGAIAAIAVVVVLGWFLGVSPIVSQATTASDQLASVNQANSISVARLASLRAEFANVDTLKTQLAALRQSVPSDAAISSFINEINALCSKDHVSLTSVTVNDAAVYVAPAAPVSATTAGSTATPSPTPTPQPSTTPAAGTSATPPSSGNGLVLVPVVVNVQGAFQDVVSFSGDLQTGSRLFLIDQVAIAAGTSGTGKSFQGILTGNVFALPGTSGVLPGGTSTPTPAATPSPSITPTAPPSSTSTPTPTGTPTP